MPRTTKTAVKSLPAEAKTDFQKRFDDRMNRYREDFDVDSLNQSNDKALLEILIRSELILESFQLKMQSMLDKLDEDDSDIRSQATEIKKIADLIKDMSSEFATLQKTLSIDRKTRKAEQANTTAEYIRSIKRDATNFVEKRLIRIYCPDCKVMVARYSPVHEHTAFIVSTECSQCGKAVRANRDARDIWFDIKDHDWRRKYPVEIVQPTSKGFNADLLELEQPEDNLIIEAETFSKEVSILDNEDLDIPKIKGLDDEDQILNGD